MNTLPHLLARYRARERGVTLVELLIAVAMAVFLLAGLFTIVFSTRRVYASQNLMAQLQDNERMAMTMISDVVQQAGYYPDPTQYTQTGSFPVSGAFATVGQSVVGTYSAAAPGDTITVRYMTASGDLMINCTGGTNSSGATQLYVNQFLIDASGYLACSLNGAANVELVSGLQNMSILYGVKTDFTFDNGAPDSYMNASQMSAINWMNVITAKITLTFVNPLASQPGQPATIVFQRVVAVMHETGVTT
jgi:type IV pilus assembly protein PilW